MNELDGPLTEKRVQALLMRDRWAKHFALPGYTPAGWWENDVFLITESGYWWEFEIKLTLADFKADSGKSREVYPRPYTFGALAEKELKHTVLEQTTDRGPCRFYYVAPVGVIPVKLLPTWAGLIELEQSGKAIFEKSPTVEAPRRHKNKVTAELRQAALTTCYWRFHRLR